MCESQSRRQVHFTLGSAAQSQCEELVEDHDDALAAAMGGWRDDGGAALRGFCTERTKLCAKTKGKKKSKKKNKKKKKATSKKQQKKKGTKKPKTRKSEL